jgi:hypothetical protein
MSNLAFGDRREGLIGSLSAVIPDLAAMAGRLDPPLDEEGPDAAD